MYKYILTCITLLTVTKGSCALPCYRGVLPEKEILIEKEDVIKLKRCIYSAQRTNLPPVVTHNVIDDDKDPVLTYIRRIQLFNRREDRVKVSYLGETFKRLISRTVF